MLDPAVLTEVSGLLRTRVDAASTGLEREPIPSCSRAGATRFTGRLISAVVETKCMQAGGRRRLRERYIAALASRDDIDSQLLRAGLLAPSERPEAFEAALRVAEHALALGRSGPASSAIRTAERAAGADAERLAGWKHCGAGRAPGCGTMDLCPGPPELAAAWALPPTVASHAPTCRLSQSLLPSWRPCTSLRVCCREGHRMPSASSSRSTL